jgi:hypothetical protein
LTGYLVALFARFDNGNFETFVAHGVELLKEDY